VNDQSDPTGKGFDPALVEETKTNIGFLLEMIEALAPVHYNGLKTLARLDALWSQHSDPSLKAVGTLDFL
jgi:hypothetical protein